MSLKERLWRFVGLMGLVFVVSMVVVIATTLQAESIALIIGVVLGILALAIPVSIGAGVFYLGTRMAQRKESKGQQAPPNFYVLPSQPTPMLPGQQAYPPYPADVYGGRREFEVIGEDVIKR